MRQRFENISLIENLFGLNIDIITITNYKGNSFDDYTDYELEQIANEQISIDDEMTDAFCDYHDKVGKYRF